MYLGDSVSPPSEQFAEGDRVRIRALRKIGSARKLNGLTGEVVQPHAYVSGWYKIRLDPNSVTDHLEWSVPADRLVRCSDSSARQISRFENTDTGRLTALCHSDNEAIPSHVWGGLEWE